MSKSRKSKESNFRYQRVDLSRDDSTDSDDDLDRILGPSSNPSMQNLNRTRKPRKNKCVLYCSLVMLMLTLAVFGGKVIYIRLAHNNLPDCNAIYPCVGFCY